MNKFLLFPICIATLLFSNGYCEVSEAAKKLAAEMESYCASTASTKPTPQIILDKVTQACNLINNQEKSIL